jgi:hypothetical protein
MLPMFLNKSINWYLFVFLLIIIITDVSCNYIIKCLGEGIYFWQFLIGQTIFGSSLGVASIFILYSTSPQLMFFNEFTTKDICTIPKKTQFQCTIYKNGVPLKDYVEGVLPQDEDGVQESFSNYSLASNSDDDDNKTKPKTKVNTYFQQQLNKITEKKSKITPLTSPQPNES